MTEPLKYKLRKNQAFGLSLSLGYIAVAPFLFILTWLKLPSSADKDLYNVKLIFQVAPLLLILVTTGLYWCFRRIELTIDDKGLKTKNKLLNIIPSFTDIALTKNTQAHFLKNNSCAKVRLFKLTSFYERLNPIVVFDSLQPQKKLLISSKRWDIDDIFTVEQKLNELGIKTQSLDAKKFNQNQRQLDALDKKSEYCAYLTIALLLISITLPLLNKWSTIYYGAFKHSLWGVLLASSLIAFLILKKNIAADIKHKFVAALFGLAFTALFFSVTMSIAPIFGSHTQTTFVYQKTNENGEETWVSESNHKLKIFCTRTHHHEPQIATITKFTSIVRVNTESLCPNGEYLSDAMFPHE